MAVFVLRPPATQTAGDDGVLLADAIVEHIGPELGFMRPARNAVAASALAGVLAPAGERGSIAIIGRDAASVEAVRQQALDAVDFSI